MPTNWEQVEFHPAVSKGLASRAAAIAPIQEARRESAFVTRPPHTRFSTHIAERFTFTGNCQLLRVVCKSEPVSSAVHVARGGEQSVQLPGRGTCLSGDDHLQALEQHVRVSPACFG